MEQDDKDLLELIEKKEKELGRKILDKQQKHDLSIIIEELRELKNRAIRRKLGIVQNPNHIHPLE